MSLKEEGGRCDSYMSGRPQLQSGRCDSYMSGRPQLQSVRCDSYMSGRPQLQSVRCDKHNQHQLHLPIFCRASTCSGYIYFTHFVCVKTKRQLRNVFHASTIKML